MCMPALGGRIKVENDEFDKASRAYMLANPTSSKKSKNVKSTKKITMVSKLDMFRHGLIHLDMSQGRFYLHGISFCVFSKGDGHSLSYS